MTSDVSAVPLTSEQQMNMFRLRDKMSLLNSEFLTVLNGFYAEKNHYDFTGTMKSYMDHVQKLKLMYKVDDEVVAAMGNVSSSTKQASKHTEVPSAISGSVSQRKIAKATRRNGSSSTVLRATDSPKIANTTVFAASSPTTVTSAPKFGDISVIAQETPAPLSKIATTTEPPAPATARKRAIRGGGPLGGSESVIFKSGNEQQASTSIVKIPETTIKFPEPSKDFWTKKDNNSGEGTATSTGSLFAFLGKDGTEKPKEPTKFTGFSFAKRPEVEKEAGVDKPPIEKVNVENPVFGTSKNTENSPPKTSVGSLFGSEKSTDSNAKASLGSLFGAPKDANNSPKLSQGPIFGSSSGKGETTSPVKPLVFGEEKEKKDDAPKPFAALSFGASLFGSSAGKSPATATSTLSFGSGGNTGSVFGGFAGLAQKAMDNQSKPDNGDEEEGEYVPPKVETVEAEEPDSILSSKVAAFKFNGKDYTKLGVGMLHVKNTDGKFSVLIRAATTTGTVWLNASCNKAMKATKADEKGDKIRLTCPTSMTEMTTMMIRFGTADGAKKFLDKVEEVSK
uniref:RanBD1 domain-containing protein n=1 Tax=Caenorhabditis tropicalis TaxID=1561998 RepID=A0A1I7SXH1_9PELO